jgi:hypothetical protein
MKRKFDFKKGALKFAAIASALAFTIGQFGGYTLTAFADNEYKIEGGTLTISGNTTAEGVLEKLKEDENYGTVTKVVVEKGAKVAEDAFADNSNIISVVNNGSTTLKLVVDSTKDSFWKSKKEDKGVESVAEGDTVSKTYYVKYIVDGETAYVDNVTAGEAATKTEEITGVTTWYDADGNVYDFKTLAKGTITLYSTPDGANAKSSDTKVITITADTSDDDDDTYDSSNSGISSKATEVTMSGANSTSVAERIKTLAAGSTLTVDMSSNKTVAKNVLEAAKGKNVDVVLDMGGYKWTINGSSIGSDVHNVNMGVTFAADDIPQDEISEVAGDDSYKTISLDYDGEFGFTGFLSFGVGSENAGKYVNLYYFNADKQLEYQNSGIVDKDGNTSLSFSHASEYVAVISDTKASASPAAAAVKTTYATSPVTADAAAAVPFILLMCASAAAMVAAATYKKRHI